MASDGYLLVKSRLDGEWYPGTKDGFQALWSKERAEAKRFDSQSEFWRYFRQTFAVSYKGSWGHYKIVRFVRVRPRKEAE